jgi:nickel superoxide dismutase
MYRKSWLLSVSLAIVAFAGTKAWAHCQVPCGIYDDPARFTAMREHVTTIEKSINQIEELSGAEEPNYNQIVRWVMNKENHADQLTEIATYYFLAQRIKPTDNSDQQKYARYLRELMLLHQIVVHAMKAKQTTDLEHVAALRQLIDQFEASYLGEKTAKQSSHSHGDGHVHAHPHR